MFGRGVKQPGMAGADARRDAAAARPRVGERGGGPRIPTDPATQVIGGRARSSLIPPGANTDTAEPKAGGLKTRVWAGDKTPTVAGRDAAEDLMTDPVVGWLVVVDGPGKGYAAKLGHGQNHIGRASKHVALNFGDEQMSRDCHATVVYVPKDRAFFIRQGGGRSIAYVDGAPVLSPQRLKPMSRIGLGATTLVFAPLCGEDFAWDEGDKNHG